MATVKTETNAKLRRFGCMVECKPGTCAATAEAKAAAWGGKVHAGLGCGPHQVTVKLNDGRDVAVGSESRMYFIVVTDPNFVAVYAEPFASTPLGKLFAKLSAARDRDTVVATMKAFAPNDGMFDAERLFSASRNRNWAASRGIGTKAAWRIGQAGGVILVPVVPAVAACYKLGRGAGRSNVVSTTTADLSAAMADCE